MSDSVKVCPKCSSSQYTVLSSRAGGSDRMKSQTGHDYYCKECKQGFENLKTQERKGFGGRPPKALEQIMDLQE